MTQYQKNEGVYGKWVKGSEIQTGTVAKLVSEVKPEPSQFQNKDGSMKMQDVGKIRFQDGKESMNISLNRATIHGLIDAFGNDSKEWIGKLLTAVTERMVVGGKRVTAIYLLPEGYELIEDSEGYMKVVNQTIKDETVQIAPAPMEDEINPNDIPF